APEGPSSVAQGGSPVYKQHTGIPRTEGATVTAKVQATPDWATATNLDVLLTVIRERLIPVSYQPYRLLPGIARRLQLLSCACTRMVWELLPTDAQNSILVRERFADGQASEADLHASA